MLNSILTTIILALNKESDKKCSIMTSTDSNLSLSISTSLNLMINHSIPIVVITDPDLAKDVIYRDFTVYPEGVELGLL